ncbi:hypothetical protein ACFQU2_04100 [Siccirubricoccus deserti]
MPVNHSPAAAPARTSGTASSRTRLPFPPFGLASAVSAFVMSRPWSDTG